MVALTKNRTVLTLVVVTVVAYANTLGNAFVWDDQVLITDNNMIRNSTYVSALLTTDLARDASCSAAYYRPLQTLTYMWDYFVWGLNPAGYHLTNLLLHLTCVLFVWMLVYRITKHNVIALVVAAVFAVHPVNTSAVTYAAGRADSLAFIAMLGSFLLFLRYHDAADEFRLIRMAIFAASLGCFVAALFSRENALLLPILLFLYSWLLNASTKLRLRTALDRILPYIMVATGFLWWRWAVLQFQNKPTYPDVVISVTARLEMMLRSVATYAGLLAWPAHLQMDRQLPAQGPWAHVLTAAGVLMVVGLALAWKWSYHKSTVVCFGLSWFAITLLPMTGVLNLTASVAEHWLYVPSVGLYLAAVAATVQLLEALRSGNPVSSWAQVARPLAATGCAVALLILTARTIVRNMDWANPATLFATTKRSASQSTRARNNLGLEYMRQQRWDEALAELQEAHRLHPEDHTVMRSLAALYLFKGDLDQALAKHLDYLRLDPENADVLLRIAEIYDRRSDFEHAYLSYQLATTHSLCVEPRLQCGSFLLAHRRFEQALQMVAEAYDIDPGCADIFNLLGGILTERGQFEQAQQAFVMARDLDRHASTAKINLSHLAAKRAGAKTARVVASITLSSKLPATTKARP
jgi:tetratricopeptide (TPR) repeat protein